MSSYMKGWSKRKPYNADRIKRGNRMSFMSSPVRHLLESLERESALEKPYLDYRNPRRKHQETPGWIRRFYTEQRPSKTVTDRQIWGLPECTLFMRLDCDETPYASLFMIHHPAYHTLGDFYFHVACDHFLDIAFPIVKSSYEVGEVLIGKWLSKPSDPFKMTCWGSIKFTGKWTIEQERTRALEGTSIVAQGRIRTGSPGPVGNDSSVMGVRGEEIHKLRELDLDPDLASLAGHNRVTGAAQLAAFGGGGSQFNQTVGSVADGSGSTLGGGGETSLWRTTRQLTGVINCPAQEIDVSCDGEKCEEASSPRADLADGALEVTAGGAAVTIGFNGGVPPFYWVVSPSEFTLASTTTTARTNELTAGASACGAASLKVTDACGKSVFWIVRETGGVNTNWTETFDCGSEIDNNFQYYGINGSGEIIMDDWCAGNCGVNCTADCPQTVPYSGDDLGSDKCQVEANVRWSWTCN